MKHPTGPAKRATLLVVDDEEDLRTVLASYLEGRLVDVDVVQAANGPEALQIIKSRQVDGIVTDFRMPGMDGLAMVAAARQMKPRLPVLLTTAYPDVGLAQRALNDQRISYFVTKPADPNRLVEYVADMLWEGARANMVRGLVGLTRELGKDVAGVPSREGQR